MDKQALELTSNLTHLEWILGGKGRHRLNSSLSSVKGYLSLCPSSRNDFPGA